MYVAIRRYRIPLNTVTEVTHQVETGFLPLLKRPWLSGVLLAERRQWLSGLGWHVRESGRSRRVDADGCRLRPAVYSSVSPQPTRSDRRRGAHSQQNELGVEELSSNFFTHTFKCQT